LKILLSGASIVFASIAPATSADSHIDLIERNGTNQVNIHFETVANRTYALQYRNGLSFTNAPGTPTTGWSNLFVAPSLPFQNHYVVTDWGTNRQRYYRLRVTP
jgi:hypothetical protein